MARIIKKIELDGKEANALFDTGSNNTYISKMIAPYDIRDLRAPFRIGLGGEAKEIKAGCMIEATIEGLFFSTDAYIVEKIGVIDGKKVDMIIGARTMEQWEIKLDPKTGELDLAGLKRREFVEF